DRRVLEAAGERCRERLEVAALARDDDEVRLAELRRVAGRPHPGREVRAAGDVQTELVQCVRVVLAPRQHTHVCDAREVHREEAPDRPRSCDDDVHRRSHASENSRPPVRPLGRRMSTSAMSTPSTITRVPDGRLSVVAPKMPTPLSAEARNESRALIARAPMTAPHRLDAPPTTSIASVTKVRSR